MMAFRPNIAEAWEANTDELPPSIPSAVRLVRLHVAGDFGGRDGVEASLAYIRAWRKRLLEAPHVTCWGYTRSWVVPRLRRELNRLRRDVGPRLQLFASVDRSMRLRPPRGWRVAYESGAAVDGGADCLHDVDGTQCVDCGYCFKPGGNVVFRAKPATKHNADGLIRLRAKEKR
jgi:hypothetical protein